ncbi:MAG: type II toxin-antitoxin system PemK/MazF family toxin [candidate division NC10 bacterium]|nr:type II toxin-antitoxin system PemK/MazF family toxin [candidate division NC10 bacterium]
MTLDRSRLRRKVGALSSEVMSRVDAAIRVSLDVG